MTYIAYITHMFIKMADMIDKVRILLKNKLYGVTPPKTTSV